MPLQQVCFCTIATFVSKFIYHFIDRCLKIPADLLLQYIFNRFQGECGISVKRFILTLLENNNSAAFEATIHLAFSLP